MTPPRDPARTVALDVLLRQEKEEAWVDRAFPAEAARARLDGRDRGLAAQLVNGTVKAQRLLDACVAALADRDPARLDPTTRCVVRLGAYQLLLLDRIPPHAAVSTAVDLASARRGKGGAGLVNALLRRVADGGRAWVEALPDVTIEDAALRRSYPDWIAELWERAYGPDAARALMDAGNATPEVAFRVSALRPGADERIAEEFARLDCALRPDGDVPSACVVEGAVDLAATAAFQHGDLVPMSRSAQRIAPFLGPEPGMRVLDACAAPGGKSGHIADLLGGGRGLTCVERDPGRARALAEALARQGVEGCDLLPIDVFQLPAERTGYDRILVDAPCTGLGTLGSRPDARWRRQPEDVARLAALQRGMVDFLVPRLAPGGVLVLSLCTLGTEESRAADAHAIEARLELRPDQGAGEGFTAVRLAAAR
ncbi:MAG: transcription antitermination factor NusB [Gaiellales bacterium]